MIDAAVRLLCSAIFSYLFFLKRGKKKKEQRKKKKKERRREEKKREVETSDENILAKV